MSMLEEVLREELARTLRAKEAMQAELERLPRGYVSRKQIRGKPAFYLQWREKDKVKSRYVPAAELPGLIRQVGRRRQLIQSIRALNAAIERIGRALR